MRAARGARLALVCAAVGLLLTACGSHARLTLLYAWGEPMGRGPAVGGQVPFAAHTRPGDVTGVSGAVVQIATSNSDSYALTSAGGVWAWGAGSFGELGDGATTSGSFTAAVQVDFPSGVRIASLANPMPIDGGLAIDTHGHLWAWGNDRGHEFCLPGTQPETRPVELPVADVTLAAGALTHIVFDSDGRIYTCGGDGRGVRGDGRRHSGVQPTAVVGLPGGPVKAVTASWGNAGVLMADGAFYDWGFNRRGQLGDGTTKSSARPVPVALPGPVAAVSEGGSLVDNGQTLALLADGSLWVWGNGRDGQLGNGRRKSTSTPVRVALPKGVRPDRINSGGATCYFIDRSGRLWAWGSNANGEVGTGSPDATQLIPVDVGISLTQVSSTAAVVAGLVGR